ncbi:MAG: hypothetical protein FWD26_03105 [Treponema sp.]|nr:hypothetical protein [Treponema sp.]
MKKHFLLLIFILVLRTLSAESMYSPTWGFYIDIPEGYEYIDGNARDRFSFAGPEGLRLDLVVYNGVFNTMLDLAEDVNRRLQNKGDVDFFKYNGKQAAIIKLTFGGYDGWGLAVELGSQSSPGAVPMLLALSYCPAEKKELEIFHLSALDSIAPTAAECLYPGPVTEYSYPRGEAKRTPLALSGLGDGLSVMIYENDAEAAQVLIEREFLICQAYLNTPFLQDASIRYYRFVYRDSYDRIKDAVSVIADNLGGFSVLNDDQKRSFAQRVLAFIQGFKYERFITDSDFLNLVTAVTEGRGDCDSHSMLFAIILSNANIRSAMMLSYQYSHAMGLADIPGAGARFDAYGTQWLVAETTAKIDIGLIAQEQSNPQHWFAILFE